MREGRSSTVVFAAVLAAPGVVSLGVLLVRATAPAPTISSAVPVAIAAQVLGRRAPAEHGVVELQFRGARGCSAKVYWEGGQGEMTDFPASVDVPFGQVCVKAWKPGEGSFHEDFELTANSPKKTLLLALHERQTPSAAELGFIPERGCRQGNRQQAFLKTDYGGGDWMHYEPATPVSIDVAGQVWRGEERVGNIAPATLAEMLARSDAAAASPLSPEYVDCYDCGGSRLALYRFVGDPGTLLSTWGGMASHRTSPEARRLIEWGSEVLLLAWNSD
jgi:hypothetical protein